MCMATTCFQYDRWPVRPHRDFDFGSQIDRLMVNGRWNDTDITHVMTENLEISEARRMSQGGAVLPAGSWWTPVSWSRSTIHGSS